MWVESTEQISAGALIAQRLNKPEGRTVALGASVLSCQKKPQTRTGDEWMECEKAQRMIFVSWFPKVLPFENGVYIAGTKRLILYYLLYSIVLSTCITLNIG